MEITLANELGVSRTPVRGAMARLADEGLLVYVPNKGFQVRRFNAKDVFDAFSLRANLEGMACRLLGERGIDGVFAQLAATVMGSRPAAAEPRLGLGAGAALARAEPRLSSQAARGWPTTAG
jgi:DNA-binding GntR family transcriptional regulator